MLMRNLFDRRSWLGHSHFGPALGPQLLRLPMTAPIAVVDTGDFPYINRADLFLLSRCKFYFKRELPPDHWRLFTKTVHRELPTRRFRQAPLAPRTSTSCVRSRSACPRPRPICRSEPR